ncbi:MAG: DUF4367 domain-containing protein [Clostridia bacterium]|nr:DUF4367 domain-containing protein [Clostridia bacterium]
MEISDAMLASALIRIKSGEVSAIPDDDKTNHVFSADFEKKMDELISSFDKRKPYASAFRSVPAKAAVIILTLCIGAFSLIMTSPQARAAAENAVNAIMEFYETHIKFYFISGNETPADFVNYENVTAEYIPQGFTLKEKYSEYEAVGCRYENENGSAYDIYVSLNDGLAVHTDKSGVEKILISGREAYLISDENGDSPYSTLIITGNKITVTIYGQLRREEIIKVGESIKEK